LHYKANGKKKILHSAETFTAEMEDVGGEASSPTVP
jgi:hypothetical protein